MKIYFTLTQEVGQSPVLFGSVNDRKAEIALSTIPEIIEKKDSLLFEEQVLIAENYLRSLIN